jgi:hypothetical protein
MVDEGFKKKFSEKEKFLFEEGYNFGQMSHAFEGYVFEIARRLEKGNYSELNNLVPYAKHTHKHLEEFQEKYDSEFIDVHMRNIKSLTGLVVPVLFWNKETDKE